MRRQYLTRLTLSRLAVHHYMDQDPRHAALPTKPLQRAFAEDRDAWVKGLLGRHVDQPALRQNTTAVSLASLAVSAGLGTVANPADIVLLGTHYDAYHLPADTPVAHLEFTSFFRGGGGGGPGAGGAGVGSKPAPGGSLPAPAFVLPPPCLVGRVHPVQVYLKQDAVMQCARFARSCRIGSIVVGAEVNTSAFQRLLRQISDAPDVAHLATAGEEVWAHNRNGVGWGT